MGLYWILGMLVGYSLKDKEVFDRLGGLIKLKK